MTGRAYGAAGDVKFCDEKRLLPRAADKAFHYRLIVKLKQLHPRFDNISFADLDAPNPNLVLGGTMRSETGGDTVSRSVRASSRFAL
ncbi:MAG: hypothetical protein WBF59_03760, partial [Bradyrhizobium sp.]|uniref:hypothetical protein n=1 Tax=Bradyrhizobium sp. TaxID=376 RepID=UPI003C72132B